VTRFDRDKLKPFSVFKLMKSVSNKKVLLIAVLFSVCFISSCSRIFRARQSAKKSEELAELGTTIGMLADVIVPESIPVEGFGLVGGLNGTGSAECPPQVRAYLKQYILTQLPERIDIDKFINSKDTAVVRVYGVIPAAASQNQRFDVQVTALPGTQTISLENGWLYRTELILRGTFGISTRVLAVAEGPLFMDKITSSKTDTKLAYVLGGGRVAEESTINLIIRRPDFRVTSLIRNCLDGRFGYDTAKAVSPNRVELNVPDKYREAKQRFAEMVRTLFLDNQPESSRERIKTLVSKLASSRDDVYEIALEAIGNESLDELSTLLNSSDEQVRLRAARCMLNLGSDQSIPTLRKIARDGNSPYRLEALEAIAKFGKRDDIAAISRILLGDHDFEIKLAAYEQLQKLNDFAISQRLVARSFYLDQVAQIKQKTVFVYRSGQARIVLFGSPIYCRDSIFIQSADGNITINASPGDDYVSIIRKHPRRPDVILQLKSSFELADIITTLCGEPLTKDEQVYGGLGVSYADMIALLKQMCDKGAISAEFRAGDLPKIG
jgi:flagellar basal body P-ring protein FlgI